MKTTTMTGILKISLTSISKETKDLFRFRNFCLSGICRGSAQTVVDEANIPFSPHAVAYQPLRGVGINVGTERGRFEKLL